MGGFGSAMGGWGGFGWFGMLIPLLFWGGFLALLVWAVIRIFPSQQSNGGSGITAQGNTAEEILRRRLADGEINTEEYEHSLQVLRAEHMQRA